MDLVQGHSDAQLHRSSKHEKTRYLMLFESQNDRLNWPFSNSMSNHFHSQEKSQAVNSLSKPTNYCSRTRTFNAPVASHRMDNIARSYVLLLACIATMQAASAGLFSYRHDIFRVRETWFLYCCELRLT